MIEAPPVPTTIRVPAREAPALERAVPARGPGRPVVRTREYLEHALSDHRALVSWFTASRGMAPASDCQLYDAFLTAVTGSRPTIDADDLRKQIKTHRNVLAEARRRRRELETHDAVQCIALAMSSLCTPLHPGNSQLPGCNPIGSDTSIEEGQR